VRFCWWAYGRLPTEELSEVENDPTTSADSEGRGSKATSSILLAGGAQSGEGVVGAVDHAVAILEGVLRDAPAAGAKSAT
jgi:hypothetical protein